MFPQDRPVLQEGSSQLASQVHRLSSSCAFQVHLSCLISPVGRALSDTALQLLEAGTGVSFMPGDEWGEVTDWLS